ncbi:MAG: ABC transporter ATP-binding protein [Candidatus Moraniibacteriota bacterium]
MNGPLLHVENLNVTYNEGKQNEMRSLQDISLDIYPEEYVIVFGPSGCGKSTLLYSLAALQAPTSGEIFFNGQAFSQMSKKDKLLYHQLGMGIIFQAFFLIPSLTIIDNICLPKLFRNEDKQARREEGMQLLKRFGILEQAFKFPSELSGGQKQRASIARSMINKPDIIFADEPVGNLDSASATNVLEILKELNEVDKKTIILVTHEQNHLQYGDRNLFMKDGRLVKEEVRKEKRAFGGSLSKPAEEAAERLPELEMLLRSFRGMPEEQASVLLLPYKIKQLMFHIFSEITEEQVRITEGFLRDYFFNTLDKEQLAGVLDAGFAQGGANWNTRRALSFSNRVNELVVQAKKIKESPQTASSTLSAYLVQAFSLRLNEEQSARFEALLKERLDNATDCAGLGHLLDIPWEQEGLGLHKFTAERIAREVELILLLKY